MSNVLLLSASGRQRRMHPAPLRLLDLFAHHRHGIADVRWLKENAELLRLLVATGTPVDQDRLATTHAMTALDLPGRMAFFPQYYRFFLSIALDLQALGLDGLDATGMVARAWRDGLPEAELSDLQRAEARLFATRAGIDIPDDPALTQRLLRFAQRAETFALPNKKAAYELTHIVFYLSNYGSHSFEGAKDLVESLHFAGLVAWLEQNTDLLAEICMALRFCGSEPPLLWEARVTADLAAFDVRRAEGPGFDDYHAWLMAAWSVTLTGGTPLSRTLPEGPLAFVAPRSLSALPELSAALFELHMQRGKDWPVMRDHLAAQVSPYSLEILDRAAASSPAFVAFFARFARALPREYAA